MGSAFSKAGKDDLDEYTVHGLTYWPGSVTSYHNWPYLMPNNSMTSTCLLARNKDDQTNRSCTNKDNSSAYLGMVTDKDILNRQKNFIDLQSIYLSHNMHDIDNTDLGQNVITQQPVSTGESQSCYAIKKDSSSVTAGQWHALCDKDIPINAKRSTNTNDVNISIELANGKDADTNSNWLNYSFPFENLAFSGGGVKGYSYVGAIKAFEDAGIMPCIKRYAGTSSGAMFAASLAVGYTAQEICSALYIDFTEVFNDQRCACIFCVPKLYTDYGIHPAKKFYDWFGLVISAKTGGNPNFTFKQCYEEYGKEVCIVVCNLTRMGMEYCHHSTTPDLPLRDAVRMSMAVPVVYEPAKLEIDGKTFYYVDGSIGDHFPLHCFDGVSVGQNLQEELNMRTIGLFVLSEKDSDHVMWKNTFREEIPNKPNYMPETKLARGQLLGEIKKRKKSERDFNKKHFMKQLEKCSHASVDAMKMKHYETNKEAVGINNFLSYLECNLAMMVNYQVVRKMKPKDLDRTVPINVGYVQTHSYDLEPADREFLLKQGYISTKAFLEKFVDKKKTIT